MNDITFISNIELKFYLLQGIHNFMYNNPLQKLDSYLIHISNRGLIQKSFFKNLFYYCIDQCALYCCS
jgi:hypothetical protein